MGVRPGLATVVAGDSYRAHAYERRVAARRGHRLPLNVRGAAADVAEAEAFAPPAGEPVVAEPKDRP